MTSSELTRTPPQLNHTQILELAAQNSQWFNSPVPRLSCEVLGRGESFTAWLVRDASGSDVVIRVPTRPVAELSQALEAEFAALRRAPFGLSAQPVEIHSPTPADSRAYVVTTRVPGAVRPASAWTTTDFERLAQQLARLHVRAAGEPGIHTVQCSPVGEAEAALEWWTTHEPEAAATLDPLTPAFLRHQKQAAHDAPQAERCFIHGDVSLANVVIDADGTPRLVDWEWSQMGDPAKDLAYSGGAVFLEPFYASMTHARIQSQALAYAGERERLKAPVDLEPLLIRRSAYLLHEIMFTSAHFWRVAQEGGADAQLYARRSALMRDRVSYYLSDSPDGAVQDC